MMKKQENGFSLIELLLVLAILSIILGIASPIYADLLDEARFTADQFTLAMIERAETFYAITNNRHSFDSVKPQNESQFSDSIAILENGYLESVTFQSIQNPRWERTRKGWQIGYDLPRKMQEENKPETWNKNVVYAEDDCVVYQEGLYQARKSNKGLIPGLLGSPWQEITPDWRVFNVYQIDDLVLYEDRIYQAIQLNEGKSPVETTYWKPFDASK